MEPRISVITVVKDDFAGLKKTADSIIFQDFENFEWLIVDGNSTDGTWEYAQELTCHAFVTLFQTPPKGIYDAMNFGAKQSRGSWLWFINAGDVLLTNQTIKKIDGLIEINSEVSLIASPVVYLTPSSHYYSISIPKIIEQDSARYGIFHHQGCILKVTIFAQSGGFDESLKLAADGKLIDLMISISSPAIVSIVTIGFEMGGTTSKNFWNSMKEIRMYRYQIFSKRNMVFFQIKEKLRSALVNIDKSSMGKNILSHYFLRREASLVQSAALMGLELPHTVRIYG